MPTQKKPVALVRVLDKMTARVAEMRLPVGETTRFGTIDIIVRTCRATLPEETPPESAAYLEVTEIKVGLREGGPVFSGWMFASSPALSAMEHPVYDIWLTGCEDNATSSNPAQSG